MRRFEQEARAAAALNHPNILAVYQMATHEGVPYMVTELLEGETLRERLRRGPMPLRKAIDYAVQIAHGLAAAHDKGIVHRDLKPENLFVTKDGRVKILDFGLAKLSPAERRLRSWKPLLASGTEPGMVMGTVGYMSPEQVRGKTVDHRTDIFAFGTILYEMVTGKQTFRKPTSAETMTAILNEDPPSISQIAPSHASGVAAGRASLPGEESGAALSLGIGFGVCAGGTVGFGQLLGSCHRPGLALALGVGSRQRQLLVALAAPLIAWWRIAACRSGGGVGHAAHRRWRTKARQPGE